jgi:hypothetical protein
MVNTRLIKLWLISSLLIFYLFTGLHVLAFIAGLVIGDLSGDKIFK